MPRKMPLALFIAAFAAVMVFGGAFRAEAGVNKPLDIGEAPWAEQEIMEMSSLEILEGYPDGRFLPYQSVTRLETVAMLIRMLGLEEQARAMEEVDVDYQVPYLPWGKGYLVMGVEKGMLDKDHLTQLQPTSAATRAQVAALVCLALDLDLSTTGSWNSFADASQIPSGYQGYVATLVDNKLMQGLPGNVFEPNSVINRAQMAVLLSNLLNNDYANPYPDRYVSGVVSNIEPISGIISFKEGTGKFLTAECLYYLNGKKVEANDIKVGDAVKLISDDNGQVVFVRAVESDQAQEVYIYVDGKIRDLGISGITLEDGDGYRNTYTLKEDVKVTIDGSINGLINLNKGDQVRLKLDNRNYVLNIEVLGSSEKDLEGEIYELDTSGTYGITIRTSNRDKFTYKVNKDVYVYEGKYDLYFDELETGDKVRLELDSYGWVDEIEVLDNSDSELEGEIYDLDISGTYGITIRNSNRDKYTYQVNDDVYVYDSKYDLDFDELEDGYKVRLELDSDGWVDEIEVLGNNDSELEGEIYELDTSGTYGITIRNSSRDKYTYKVNKDVYVYEGKYDLDFDELETGDEVRLELDRYNWVDEIEVLDQTTEKGIISGLRIGSSPRLYFTNKDDDETRYDISDDVECERDDKSIDLEDIVIGSEAEIEVKNGEAVTIIITDDQDITIEGEIIDIRVSSERLEIEQSSGNQFTYYLDDNAVFRDNKGYRIDLLDVEEDWDVELRLRDGKIYRLTQQ